MTDPDVANSTDSVALSRDFQSGARRNSFRVLDDSILNGTNRRKEYDSRERPAVDRNAFFEEVLKYRRDLLSRPDNKVSRTSAWLFAAK